MQAGRFALNNYNLTNSSYGWNHQKIAMQLVYIYIYIYIYIRLNPTYSYACFKIAFDRYASQEMKLAILSNNLATHN